MAVVEHPSATGTRQLHSDLRGAGRHLLAVLHEAQKALAAGWRAVSDYRRLSEMSDRQLRLRGLARSDIPQSLHERHFASLGGWLDNID